MKFRIYLAVFLLYFFIPFYLRSISLLFHQSDRIFLINATSESSPTKGIFKSEKNWIKASDASQDSSMPTDQKLFEFTLTYDINSSPLLSINGIRILNGYYNFVEEAGDYTMRLLDNRGSTLKSYPFTVPNIIHGPPQLSSQPGQSEHDIRLDKVKFIITVPYDENADYVEVYDKMLNKLSSRSLSNSISIDNQPDFQTLDASGDSSMSMLQSLDIAATAYNGPFLDITFIGDKYYTSQDMIKFRADAERFIDHLLTYEPFLSRSYQINFHIVEYIGSLGCYHDSSIHRLIVCDYYRVMQEVNNSGTPYDMISVITNDDDYGGSGGLLSVSYNGIWGQAVFVHELGHQLGGLADEYYTGTEPYQRLKNCYFGSPPNPLWQGMVLSSEYFLECSSSSWYRSSFTSIMRSLDAPYFNSVSRKFLNIEIDNYASPLVYPTSTPTSTIGQIPGDLTGDGRVNISDIQNILNRNSIDIFLYNVIVSAYGR